MTQLGSFALLLAILGIVGGLFALQYKLSLREKVRWIFALPMVFLVLYLAISTGAVIKGNQYTDQEFSTKDSFGNTLEMTVQVSKDGKIAALFSDLYVYDDNHVLLDEITLSYKNNKMYEGFLNTGYADEIAQMTQGIRLDGTSMQREDVTGRLYFLGVTMEKKPFKMFAVPFGVPVLLLIIVGGLARMIQSKRLRKKSIKKIDVQSLQPPLQS